MSRLRVATGSAVLVTLLVACGGGVPAPESQPSSATSTAVSPTGSSPANAVVVPDQLKFTAKTVDGADIAGADLAGKPVVLWFWAPWCPKCQREAPGVAAAAKELGGKVTFLGVAALDEVPAMQQFVQRYDLKSFQHVADVDSAVWKRFGVTAQPAYAFVDTVGKVEVVASQLSEQDLRQRLDRLG